MSKRNRIGQALLLAGGVIAILKGVYSLRYIVPLIQRFFDELSALKYSPFLEYYLVGLNWLKKLRAIGLGKLLSMLFFNVFFLFIGTLAIKWRKSEEHWANLRLFPSFMIGFGAWTFFRSSIKDIISAIISMGIILIMAGALLLEINEQKPEQTRLDKYGAAVTNISAVIMLFLSGYFMGLTFNGLNWFLRYSFVKDIKETAFGSVELWIVLMLCHYAFIGLGLLLAGRWHLLNFKGIYQPVQLRFSLAVYLLLVLAVFIWFKARFMTFSIPRVRYILLLLGLFYFIGTSLLYFSARRKESHEMQQQEG